MHKEKKAGGEREEREVIYPIGSANTLSASEKRIDKLEKRQDDIQQILQAHTMLICLLQENVYRDESKNKKDYFCQNCPYEKFLKDMKN